MRRVAIAVVLFSVADARASGGTPPAPPPPSCVIRGSEWVDAVIHSNETGGLPLLRTGGPATWEVFDLPADGATGRAHVHVRTAAPGLRVDGWVDLNELSFRAKQDLPIVQGRVWVTAGPPLHIVPQGSTVIAFPEVTAFTNARAIARCDEITLGTEELPFVPAPAYWTFVTQSFALHDAPKGKPVASLTFAAPFGNSPYAAVASKDGYLHIVHREGIHFDGWVKQSDMKPWTGEPPSPPFTCGVGNISILQKNVVIRTVSEETDLFVQPGGTRAGVLEKGAKVRVTGSSKGFAEVRGPESEWFPVDTKKTLWVKSAALAP